MKSFKLILILCVLSLSAKDAAAQLKLRTTDPERDSLAFVRINERMDSIRRHRPTVGLVLSGGGAKGAAHIGTIKKLEELGIPVDIVIGTSAGGLIGSMYAMGHSSSYIDSLLREMDWKKYLSDDVDRRFQSLNNSQYKSQYQIRFPFNLGSGSLSRSLPSGFISGHNIDHFFSSLSVGYHDKTDFLEMPIPFMCVATDLVTGRAKIWYEGSLRTAMRSTMAIPGVFAPVKTDGMVLLDGGMRDNFPTDLARAAGVDYIIGVTLSSGFSSYSDINNIKDILSQSMDMFGMETYNENISIADVTINPDLSDFGALSFDKQSVDTIFSRGYDAALRAQPLLEEIASRTGFHSTVLQGEPAIDINTHPVRIDKIRFDGLTEDDNIYLKEIFDIKEGDTVDAVMIEEALSYIYGTEAFDYTGYSLRPLPDNGYSMRIDCRYSPRHRVGLGARFDNETMVSAILNIGLNANRLSGSSLNMTAKLGSNPSILLEFSHIKAGMPAFHADVFGGHTAANLYKMGESRFNITYSNWYGEIYLSNSGSHYNSLKAGAGTHYYNITSFLSNEYLKGDYNSPVMIGKIRHNSLFLRAGRNTLNDQYRPERGHKLFFDASINTNNDADTPISVFYADAMSVFRIGEHLDLIPSASTRLVFGENMPVSFRNLVGGRIAGRYLAQQIPFIGLNYATPMESKIVKAGMEMCRTLGSNSSISLIMDLVKDSDRIDKNLLFHGDTLFGAGVEYRYDTFVGPLKANIHWSNLAGAGAYISLGLDF